jgi:hypothetical protein
MLRRTLSVKRTAFAFLLAILLAACGSSTPSASSVPTDLLSRVLDYYKSAGYPETCGDFEAHPAGSQTELARAMLTTLRSFVAAPLPDAALVRAFRAAVVVRCGANVCGELDNYCATDRLQEAAGSEFLSGKYARLP